MKRGRAVRATAPESPRFSDVPTEAEIFRSHVFAEPLVPVGGESSGEERRALANALLEYEHGGGGEKVKPLLDFLDAHPDSVFRAAIWFNLGTVYRRTGYFSRALEAWEKAWTLSSDATRERAMLLGDAAVGALAELSARLGRAERLEAIFRQIEGRNVRGSATETIAGAKAGLWLMRNQPQDAFRCGPFALDRILAHENESYLRPEPISLSRSTPQGLPLPAVRDLAFEVGLPLQMAKRERSDAELLVPAVIHWRSEHYAALLEEKEGRFLVEDLTFDDRLWVSRAALEDESSGYFLVPKGTLPRGWRPVDELEGGAVWGKGQTNGQNPENIKPCDVKRGGGCKSGSCPRSPGVASYAFHALAISLNITDIPLGYSPPRGPRVDFEVTYNQRDSFQPANFTYSNLGRKWTFDYLSYVEDDPNNPDATVFVYVRGGGRETYPDLGGGTYTTHFETYADLVQVSHAPPVYERRLPDGSVEVFSQSDGASGPPRKVFMTESRDPQGNALTFTYDANPLRLTGIVDALGQTTELFYEIPGDDYRITRVVDPFGREAKFEYDSQGQLATITDVIELTSSFEYGANDFVTALITPYGRTTFAMDEYDYNNRNRSLEATDPLGGRERIEYIDKIDTTFVPDYLDVSEVPFGVDPNDNEGFEYRNTFYWSKLQMNRSPGDYKKAEILHWLKERDASPNLTSGTLQGWQMPLEGRVWYVHPFKTRFNERGTSHQPTLVARVLDDGTTQQEKTQAYQYEYNSRGKVTKSVDAVGRETRFVYDMDDIDLLDVKQWNGATEELLQSFSGYANHQPTMVKDASGETTSYTYNSFGQVETITTPERIGVSENRTTTYEYDGDGYLERVMGPTPGATTSYTYDGAGRVRTVTDSDGYTVTYDYDDLDRVTKVTYPDGTYEETIYDKLDPVWTRDRKGRWTRRFYDALRRMTGMVDSLGRTVTQEWCKCGSLDAVVDANGNRTTWKRDLQGRVTEEIRADEQLQPWLYTYESHISRLKTVTDPKLQVKTYSYFNDDNLKSVTYTNEEHETPDVSFTYDDVYNRVESMTDGTGLTNYDYYDVTTPPVPGAGRLHTVNGPLANDVITYSYDELGRVESRDIDGVALTYEYDELGRIAEEMNALGMFTYDYEGVTGRLSSVSYPNGQTTGYSYYGNAEDRRLLEIHHKKPGGATLSKFGYTYDDVGNILTWTQQTDSNPANAYDFEYDEVDQLRSATWRTTDPVPMVLKRYRYAYDPAGNRTVEQIDDAPTLSSYDEMNRLVDQIPGGTLRFTGSVSEQAFVTIESVPAKVGADLRFAQDVPVTTSTSQVVVKAVDVSGNERTNTYQLDDPIAGGTKSFTFDANGNMTGDGTRTFEWDAENRLVAVNQGTLRTEFEYDGRSQRVRSVDKDNGVVITDRRFLWCDQSLCEERDSTGGSVSKRFFRLGVWEAGSLFYYSLDHLSSTREVSDSSQSIRARYDYDPYGRSSKTQGDKESLFQFTGHYVDAQAGFLTLYRAYDANLGRWLSEDPIKFGGGLNFYDYVANDPVNAVDPLGLYGTTDCSYYDRRCKTATKCKTYYCKIAPNICKRAGNNRRSNCVRLCLQEADDHFDCSRSNPEKCPVEKPKNPYFNNEHYCNQCIADTHVICFIKCLEDPDTPPTFGS